ncbi:TetR/AcrR family transcriptional regulator [Aliikangiella coralliicola]|uniref:TetR/AcrR family transcriptional regulator n=1 Tax=Aliikangiella coralliicola TaxID=2592383 RepID=A0A545UIL9_9GAMM|nr:TetR/AcrR family transcriptional regulator [Aliikangiella coralliicola]TQV89312.1 TetR/AcrR family transcriptional regulator [Aliikangiella coralliicola]
MDKKTRILTSARKLFLEQGYKSTSIQSIASESGISKGAVYLYFNSKEEILLAIFRMIEDEVWRKVSSINQDPSLSAREKYRRQIITFYNEVMENLQFNQMMLNESGIELNEAFYNYAREYRYRLQKVQEESLLAIYGDSLSMWLGDLVISTNGIMQEFDASIVLDNLELDSERLADFICNVTDFLVDGILSKKPVPIFNEKTKLVREEFLAQKENEKHEAINQQFTKLADLCESLVLSDERKQTLQETLELLKDALEATQINKTLVKALMSNFNDYSELKADREKLADLLEVR